MRLWLLFKPSVLSGFLWWRKAVAAPLLSGAVEFQVPHLACVDTQGEGLLINAENGREFQLPTQYPLTLSKGGLVITGVSPDSPLGLL